MTDVLTAPFFEVGPKNLLRLPALEQLARSSGRAGREHDVAVVLTVPTAMVAPVAGLDAGVHVFGQHLDPDPVGATVGRVVAESLVDAGAAGVMLNHAANPVPFEQLVLSVRRARDAGLLTMVCAGSEEEAARVAALRPTVVLLEPEALIGSQGWGERGWIPSANAAVRTVAPEVLVMHAGGVATPAIARSIMSAGADGTGSTSGVLSAPDPPAAVRSFVSEVRAGWDERARRRTRTHV